MSRPRTLAATAAGLILAPALAVAAPAGWSKLMEPDALAAILETSPQVRVVQVTGADARDFLPGAVAAPYAEWRGPADNPGQLPSTETLQELVQELGIGPDTPVAVVHAGTSPTDFGTAARVYWTLKSLGVEDLAILNGGLEAWRDAGLPTDATPADAEPSSYTPKLSDAWRVTTAEIQDLAARGGEERLIDARPEQFFLGRMWHDAAARPGTLPDAGNLTYDVWFDGDRMVGPEEARAIAEAHGVTDAPMTVSFCNTGHWAAINWFALSEMAEVENTRLYAESVVEWSQAGGEMANVPNRVTYYWLVLRNWVTDLFA